MAKQRYRRNPHQGVQIKQRTWKSGVTTFIARFKDPDSGVEQEISLSKLGLHTAEARRDWAIIKAKSILLRQAQIEAGAPTRTETPIETAIRDYVDMKRVELRSSTLNGYMEAIARFRTWAGAQGIVYTEQIAPKHLESLRKVLLIAEKKVALAGGRRGQGKASGRLRSPYSVNRDLRALKTLLNKWRRRGIAPLLSSDCIADELKFQDVGRPLIVFLNRDAIASLLHAALRHDAACFKETRAEHRENSFKGLTPRYYQISPLVAFLLLAGCRVDEALSLKWSAWNQRERQIELTDIGRIKTKHARRIDLAITPSLESLLALLKLKATGEYVFGGHAPLRKSHADSCRKRLQREFGAPAFTWQQLRRTCGTFLTCAPGIYGGASAWQSAKRLGHAVEVAEKHYIGALSSLPMEAKTLEAAMEIEGLMAAICAVQRGASLEVALSPALANRPVLSGGER